MSFTAPYGDRTGIPLLNV